MPVRQPRNRNTHRQHDGQRLEEGLLELPHRGLDHARLVGHLVDLHAQRKRRLQRGHARVERLADREHVAAALEGDAEHQHRLSVVAHGEARRVFQAAAHLRHIAQPQQPAARRDGHFGDVTRITQAAALSIGHAHEHAVVTPFGAAIRGDRVLAGQRVDQRLRADAQRRQPCAGEFDLDLLDLAPEHVDLGDPRRGLQRASRILHQHLQFGPRQIGRGEGVQHAVDLAELVAEEGAAHAFGKLVPHVADLLARQVPGAVELGLGRAAFHPEVEAAEALAREAAHEVDPFDLLQLALHAVEHLVLHLLRGRTGPGHHHVHRRHVEDRVFKPAEPAERHQAHQQRADQQEQHQRPVRDRPFGQVEALHRAASSGRETGRTVKARVELLRADRHHQGAVGQTGHPHAVGRLRLQLNRLPRQRAGAGVHQPHRGSRRGAFCCTASRIRRQQRAERQLGGRRALGPRQMDLGRHAQAQAGVGGQRGQAVAGPVGAGGGAGAGREFAQAQRQVLQCRRRRAARAPEAGAGLPATEAGRQPFGHVGLHFELAGSRQAEHGLPFAHHLPGFEAHGSHHAVERGLQHRIVGAVARQVGLLPGLRQARCGGGIGPGLLAFGIGRAHRSIGQQPLEAGGVAGRLHRIDFGGALLLGGSLQCQPVILRVEARQGLTRAHGLSQLDEAGGDQPAGAKAQVGFDPRAHAAEESPLRDAAVVAHRAHVHRRDRRRRGRGGRARAQQGRRCDQQEGGAAWAQGAWRGHQWPHRVEGVGWGRRGHRRGRLGCVSGSGRCASRRPGPGPAAPRPGLAACGCR